MKPTKPLKKTLVLLGAGNANLQIVKWWQMDPIPEVQLVLVNESATVPYSGMIPGCISGLYTKDEIQLDLVRFCAVSQTRLVLARAQRVDANAKRIVFEDRAPILYDFLAINVGSVPSLPKELSKHQNNIQLKPLHVVMQRMEWLEETLKASQQKEFNIVVVGAGASGCETILALVSRFRHFNQVRFGLLTSGNNLLPSYPKNAGSLIERLLKERNVWVKKNVKVISGSENHLALSDGSEIDYSTCIWATHATPVELIEQSGFATDERGFIKVKDSLQYEKDPSIFATGDCISLASFPNLAKSGVYAVRQAPTLWDNLQLSIQGEAPQSFHPQKNFLTILNTSDGKALFRYGRWVGRGAWTLKWKDYIDRKWMRKFADSYGVAKMQMSPEEEEAMRCGGCGAKVPSQVLSGVLNNLDVGSHPNILVGCQSGEDASVHKPLPGVEVQTVDSFRSFIDDPYLFGKIAANNALSDIYAMNATPMTALAIVTLPFSSASMQEDLLAQLLGGAVEMLQEGNVTLTGGHTSEASELSLGLAVTGYGEQASLFRKEALKEGDSLILTKPIGTGALLAALMRGDCLSEWFLPMRFGMIQSNREASKILAKHHIRACTDVTGFGLFGHLMEMLRSSKLSAQVELKAVPVYEGFNQVFAKGIESTLQKDNAKAAHLVSGPAPGWLFDPQTSGGLLASVPSSKVELVLEELREAGYLQTMQIGTIVAAQAEGPRIFSS